MTYTFPEHMLLSVMDHANSLDVVVTALSLSNGTYTLTTANPFPDEQLDHLSLTAV